MKYIPKTLVILFTLLQVFSCDQSYRYSQKKQTVPVQNTEVVPFPIKRGINISHWLSQNDRMGQERESFFTERDVAFIASLGYEALTFSSAEEFLASSRANESACLITDFQMPGVNGLELQSRLLAQGRRIPVIFITAFPKENTRKRALNAGAVAFLSKPFEESALIDSLELALKSSKTG